MEHKIIVAGFGGQGVLFAGTLLAQTAVEEDKHTTWFPSYGAEMRGGTANSTVKISDHEIGSPVTIDPTIVVALNEQSLDKFMPKIQKGGMIIVNSSLVSKEIKGNNIKVVKVPASEIADKEFEKMKPTNIVAIGAMLKASGIMSLENAKKACEKVLSNKPKFIDSNKKALELGYKAV